MSILIILLTLFGILLISFGILIYQIKKSIIKVIPTTDQEYQEDFEQELKRIKL